MSRKLTAIGSAVLVAILILGGFVLLRKDTQPATESHETPDDYPLLARRLFMDNPNDSIINFSPLRQSLKDYFSEHNLNGSLYFEYLPTGISIRVQGEDKEIAASLIKLPAAMELYKASEMGKINLDQSIELKAEWLDDDFGNLYEKGAGYELTLREAAQIMLQESDNTALRAIASTISGIVPQEEGPFNFLDADYNQNPDLTVSISARSYSSFLKCLYFSCYLNNENSQELLDYLANTDFDNRLRAGIDDKDVRVAHKIGNHAQDTQSDCGIVYVPQRNYLMCVMLEGAVDAETNAHIAELPRLAYEYLKSK